MSQAFAEIAYTETVRQAQARYNGAPLPIGSSTGNTLGTRERNFIAERDSFYMATVSQTGWPHVQHRGGPLGFLQVLGPTQIGFADLDGNRQYVSVGNVTANPHVAMILMDYPAQRRMKILATATVLDAGDAPPALLLQLLSPFPTGMTARRLFILDVAAFDWNCSRFITPRYALDDPRLDVLHPPPPSPSHKE